MGPFVGEIRMFAGTFPPLGWEFCDGQVLPINENETLFQLIGTTYGGDGQSTFALPDLRGRSPIHMGAGAGLDPHNLAQAGGTETVTLTVQQLPQHSHAPRASTSTATSSKPSTGAWASWGDLPYSGEAPGANLHTNSVFPAGGSQPHDNMPPFVAVHFIISLYGQFPQQN